MTKVEKVKGYREEQQLWGMANQQLIARSLSELIYEQEIAAKKLSPGCFQVSLNNIDYRFEAKATNWDLLLITSSTLTRNNALADDALQFCLDLKSALTIDDIVFGHWLEDVQNTLNNELERLKKLAEYPVQELLKMDEAKMQGLLDAHPKIIANRGRLGWGAEDNQQFSPESLQSFQLQFLAAHKSILTRGHQESIDNNKLMSSMMSQQDYQGLINKLKQKLNGTPYRVDDYALIPCHPWQFQHKVRPQFQWALQNNTLIHLGEAGDRYQPQQSIRTLSNVSRPEQYDVKLAITILNTSCYRGVPEKFIAAGHHISSWLSKLANTDAVFLAANLRILEEPAGYYVSHKYQNQIDGSPYRYHEMLGCIWRQSAQRKQSSNDENHMLLSALLQKDIGGNSLIRELVKTSQLSCSEWLRRLFKIMAIPLYHLLVKYGVGVIAHGQNVVVYFKHSIPHAIAIKDFHGDLRLLEQELPEQVALEPVARSLLTKLPKEYLVHDLLTGHFISVYRFLSPLIEEQLELPEDTFYQLLAEEIADYQNQYSEYAERFNWFDLFKPKVERICLNNVRFKIGYEDNADRPLPSLSEPLINPIFKGFQTLQKNNVNSNKSTIGADIDNSTLQSIIN